MKINFLIIRPDVDGGARVITRHAKYLQDAGHDVTMLSLGRKKIKFKDQLRLLRRGEFRRTTQIYPQFYHDAGLNLVIHDFRDALTADDVPDADVTIATWWETAEWLADLPASKGAKVHFIQGHESRLEYVDYDRAAALHRAPFHKIVVSQWLRDAMIDEFGARDCVLVGNAVDADQFDFVPRDKKHTPTVGFVYSPVVSKNPALAFAACADLRQKFPALRVVSFGSHKPGHTETFPDWIEFHHRPAQQKIAEIYAACDVWLFTRDYEGFGLPILEAMACGTPVVATRAGAAPELVDATVGALVNSTSEAIVGAATKILKADNTAWRKLSANARARAAAYGWDDAGALFERALRNFAAKTPRDIK